MKQLTDWLELESNERFLNETKRRLPIKADANIKTKIFKDKDGNDFPKKAIFVSKKYIKECEKYVLENCNAKSNIK